MTDLFSLFEGLGEFYSKDLELAAIWMERSVQTATERTARIAPGAQIRVNDINDFIVTNYPVDLAFEDFERKVAAWVDTTAGRILETRL